MRIVAAIALSVGVFGSAGVAVASECAGNPGALGTKRVLRINPAEHARFGTMQYRHTLPLASKEVVLTFDDGPLPPYTERILDILAAECVKANFFIVGRMARAHPALVRRIHAEGHVIGTHTENHPAAFDQLPLATVQTEVEVGIASTAFALGDRSALAPFFRFPGLRRSDSAEAYLGTRGLAAWSADIPADDWRHIQPKEIVQRTISRLEAARRGIILMHDIQPATVLALPHLLRELKTRGYRVVQVAPPAVTLPAPLVADNGNPAALGLRASIMPEGGSAHRAVRAAPQTAERQTIRGAAPSLR